MNVLLETDDRRALSAQLDALNGRLRLVESEVAQSDRHSSEWVSPRSAMKLLERWICFRACHCSKPKYRAGYSFKTIRRSNDNCAGESLAKHIKLLNLQSDHISLMEYMIESAERSAVLPVLYNKTDWIRVFCSDVEQDEVEMSDDERNGLRKERVLIEEIVACFGVVLPFSNSQQQLLLDPVEKNIPSSFYSY